MTTLAPPPALLPGYVSNFNTLKRAARQGDICLVSSRRLATGEPVALICAMQHNKDGTYTPVPFAEMCSDNPFTTYMDPCA